jgi:hypothetical protein
MRKPTLAAAAVLLVFSCGPLFARECNFVRGEARWGIKTSVVAGALNAHPRPIKLISLMNASNPVLSPQQKRAIAKRRWTGRVNLEGSNGRRVLKREGDLIRVEGFLYRARCQSDGDYHLEIGTRSTRDAPCFIAEAPHPSQINNRALKKLAANVRGTLDRLPGGIFTGNRNTRPIKVRISGQLFLDAPHIRQHDEGGGRGTRRCATNVWEIHPITSLQVIQ